MNRVVRNQKGRWERVSAAGAENSVNYHRMTAGLLFILAFCGSAFAGGLKPFTTDGCSLFPDGTQKQRDLWLTCCINHDLAYWMGGTSDDRQRSDRELRDCVAQAGEPEIAEVMLTGVRAGGTPYLPTAFRWGYGWPWPRGYGELNDIEWEQVKRRLSGK